MAASTRLSISAVHNFTTTTTIIITIIIIILININSIVSVLILIGAFCHLLLCFRATLSSSLCLVVSLNCK